MGLTLETSLFYNFEICWTWSEDISNFLVAVLREPWFKGSPEGSSDREFRSSILCDVIENS